ncbi:V-type ATP synthase subunit I [Frisingicoccus sp.]|uniref:V-type ATP synthase subunit I n=1 Tax=Frisingicoccus sp. TaxID=1918627 RepID=UPI003AB25C7F
MAVLQMQRISLCALKKNRKAILERLQELGAMEIDIRLEDDSGYTTMDVSNSKATFEKKAQTADRALEILQRYAPEQTGMLASLAGKPLIDKPMFEKAAQDQDRFIDMADRIVTMDKRVAEETARVQKLKDQMEALVPWMGLTVPVSYSGTRRVSILIGAISGTPNLENIYELIGKFAPDVEAVDVEIISVDRDFTYLAVVCLAAEVQAVEEALRAGGFSKPAQAVDKIPARYREELQEETEAALEEVKRLKSEITNLAGHRQNLRLVSDYYRMRAEKYGVLGKLPQTTNTFALSGYVPAKDARKIADEFADKYDAAVELEEIGEEEEAPVLLKNNYFAESGEGVLASFGLPGKGEVDPTMIMTVFYVFLFGIMLSDAAYGLIVAAACGALLVKFPRMSLNMKKSIRLFFWCGLSTLFWGVMFGGYFGDAISVISSTFFGKEVSIPPLWFAPLDEPMRMLVWSMLFGLIHLYTGLFVKAYMYIRDGKILDAVCDVGFWLLLITGLVLILMPTEIFASISQMTFVFPEPLNMLAKGMAIVGAVGILLMSGRDKKNHWGLRIALGAYDLYGITSWLSDILSYSRLLALGLATGVIASVFNQMGSMFGSGIIGAILFIIVFVIGHIFNIAINLLGAYVHTCRLQYVEFFGKFYEGGGREFHPFRSNTKYVDVKEETKV